jgi:hypothetical protein
MSTALAHREEPYLSIDDVTDVLYATYFQYDIHPPAGFMDDLVRALRIRAIFGKDGT